MTTFPFAAQQALDWASQHNESIFAAGGLKALKSMNAWSQALQAALHQHTEPRNQCAETCVRAKLCAGCAREIADNDHGCTLAQRDALLEVLQDLCDTLGECSLTNKARAAIKMVEETK